MTDYENLVKLLDETFAEQYGRRGLLTAKHTADFLIVNGVTVKQMQKPLTLDETLENKVVYLEFKHLVLQEPVCMYRDWDVWEEAQIIYYDRFGSQYSNTDCQESGYGKTWRCWAAKPTNEERRAAPWQ